MAAVTGVPVIDQALQLFGGKKIQLLLTFTAIFYVLIQIVKLLIKRAKRSRYEGGKDGQGRYHGKGVLRAHNGDVYRGQFKHGKFHGHGEYLFKKAGRYEGQFQGKQQQQQRYNTD
eukprot:TRINITY_DN50980_c0_g1_i1.p1 TRINITY_DN50980_c0_g1~~TRINITY_DN50980_c0_g1_i1.p1  ORF type:complete len:125 (+),score=55.38 TRINITY_DN50980_c0_g1_i1:28-375(+)